MRSLNHRAATRLERDHVGRVKLLSCGLCGEGGGEARPSDAHHLRQEEHYSVIPLCEGCHKGPRNGWHGQRILWHTYKLEPQAILADTIRRLFYEPGAQPAHL